MVKQSGVKQLWPWLLVCGVAALKIWLVGGVELGKDEAAYWYWSQRLDASYALLPLSAIHLAGLIVPDSEIALRIPSALCGLISLGLMYRLCRLYGLSPVTRLWATASFASCQWVWHTTSFLHPDGFLVLCWLLALVIAREHLERPSQPLAFICGAAAGLAALSKYHGVLLAAAMGLWFALSSPASMRLRYVTSYLVPLLILISPLAYENWLTEFHLPFALKSLSRIAADDPLPLRLLILIAAPTLFVSPALLWLLYAAMGRLVAATRSALSGSLPVPWRQVALVALPAAAVILWFGLFGLMRGQIKGNWILPAFLGLWPWAFDWSAFGGGNHRRVGNRLAAVVVILGITQTGVVALSVKYPHLAAGLSTALGKNANSTYLGLVSQEDERREPSLSWVERVCEYSGWRDFAANMEAILEKEHVSTDTPLVSTQYDLTFAHAFYQPSARSLPRPSFTIDDPKFRRLSDFDFELSAGKSRPPLEILFAARSGSALPHSLQRRYTWHREVASVVRSSPGCSSVSYDLVLMGH
jgi:hypothetical protein